MGEENPKKQAPLKRLADYMEALKGVADDSSGRKLIYRGHAKEKWDPESAAFRRIREAHKAKSVRKDYSMEEYLEGLIQDVKLNGWHWKEGREYKALEILALLQHNGAATCLMDWSRSPYTALWFACQPASDGEDFNGKVSIIDIADIKFTKIETEHLEKSLNKILGEEKKEKLYYWEAESVTERISRQESVFVLGDEPIDLSTLEIIIDKNYKEALIEELKLLLNITSKGLFKDLVGFANNNRHNQPIEIEFVDYLSEGNAWFHEGQYNKAIAAYTSAIRRKPDYADAYNNRGLARDKQGEYDEAIADYNEAIRLERDYAAAYFNRGLARDKQGKYDEAIADYSEAIRLKFDYVIAYNNRGLARDNKGDYDGAITDYDKVIQLKPDYAAAYYNHGNARYKKGEYTEAITDYDRAIKLKPDYVEAYNNRGNAWYDKGEYDNAITDYDKAIRLKPDKADAYYNRGRAWFKKGENDNAIADWTEAIQLKPDYALAYLGRGFAWDKKDEYDNAIADLEIAKELFNKQGNAEEAERARKIIEEIKQKKQQKKQQKKP